MTTFAGAETIVNTVEIFGNISSGANAYIVPAGRYANVSVLRILDITNPFRLRTSTGDTIADLSLVTGPTDFYEVLMLSGQFIFNSGGLQKVIALNILEFNNPS